MCIYFNVATANVYCDSHVPDALCSILSVLTHLSLPATPQIRGCDYFQFAPDNTEAWNS